MKFKGLFFAISMTFAFSACSQTNVKNIKIETNEDSLAYAIGVLNFEGLSQQDLDLDALKIAKGMIEASDGTAIFDGKVARGFYTNYMKELEEKKMAEQYKEVIEENETFLDQNKLKEGVQVTESGLQYKVLNMGEGTTPTSESRVSVHYTGTLIDGTVFDSSLQHDPPEPVEFNVGGVIAGWTEGLQLMPVGSRFMFYIPSNLAYGPRGAGQSIPPFAVIIFEVELLGIVN